MSPFFIPFIPIVFFLMIGWIATTAIRAEPRKKAIETMAEIHRKVLDRCASAPEMIAYLESRAGREFFENLSMERTTPINRILSAIQSGAVLGSIGLAAVFVRRLGFYGETDHFLLIVGALAIAIGVGFLVAAVSSYALCENWGLLGRNTYGPRV